ncbi:Spo11/DNA topoisomerase VI subunit A [Mucor mucedo]|uniref:Spo11/DNA topoisomerase VI subunit A n=1 Tax=Mucor mucedo TaxID=29922 RepID=UPI00221F972D|nr:Spo11/DNA topoisomerase VI subunit A [Mucor mucedo]KAI7887784.1 Spo11/DNA topoisomerase VI subunit A [Mucor mucedo]
MPHIILDDDGEDTQTYSTNVSDILDHTHHYPYTAPSISSSASDSISSTPPQQASTVAKTREEVMKEIQNTIEQMVTCIALGEPIRLVLNRRKGNNNSGDTQNDDMSENKKTRTLSLTSGDSAKAFARYLSVLQMIYEAIAYKIMVTKRDMFYRNVSLFGTQTVLDSIVDDISCHYNVPRSSLNVSAASKGLIYGPIIIKLKNNKRLDCMSTPTDQDGCHDEQGILIPPISQVTQVQCMAKCMIVIEKEATFRYLVSAGFCQSLPESCILITGKGYPDLSTRQFVKYFSIHYSKLPIFALMDNDPHGLDIYATYKWGAKAFAFDVFNLAVNEIELIGLTCQDRKDFNIGTECYIPMTERDKAKLSSMVRTCSLDETPGLSQLRDRGWSKEIEKQLASKGHQSYINEVNKLIRSDYKLELQALNNNGPFGLTNYLSTKLANCKL